MTILDLNNHIYASMFIFSPKKKRKEKGLYCCIFTWKGSIHASKYKNTTTIYTNNRNQKSEIQEIHMKWIPVPIKH